MSCSHHHALVSVTKDIQKHEDEKAQKFRLFVEATTQILENNGISVDTVKFVEAIDIKTPRFDKNAVAFLKEYPEEVKERIIAIILEQYVKFIEDSLGKFMRIYETFLGLQAEQRNNALTMCSCVKEDK